MKVRVAILKEVEMEINNPDLENLYTLFSENLPHFISKEIVMRARKAVEDVVGLPFGDSTANETITGVYAVEDDEPILEW